MYQERASTVLTLRLQPPIEPGCGAKKKMAAVCVRGWVLGREKMECGRHALHAP
jgi:hypothetical protein